VIRGFVVNRVHKGFPTFFSEDPGILVEAPGCIIEGNFIGTDATGRTPLGNTFGVAVIGRTGEPTFNVAGTLVGGTAPQARNIISGNTYANVGIGYCSGAQVKGNYIGTDLSGTVSIPGSPDVGFGLIIQVAENSLTGGTEAGARNIISGNVANGFFIPGSTLSIGNMVQGNYIGPDVSGNVALGNGPGIGIQDCPGTLVGGTSPGARNIISGNQHQGVLIITTISIDNLVQGNYIGVNASGNSRLPNGSQGIAIFQAVGNVVGGATASARNIISGNLDHGVFIGPLEGRPDTLGATIEGNYIGTDITGASPIGNLGCGIFVQPSSVGYRIENNIIAYNGEGGICIPGTTPDAGFRIRIRGNPIFSNNGLGIDLGDMGVTPNDDRDFDVGGNELQNFPVLTSATSSIVGASANGTLTPAVIVAVSGIFNSTPNTAFTLEFFFGSNCPGQGRQLIGIIPIPLGTKSVATDSQGNALYSFEFNFPAGFASGWVNCTATDQRQNTSEFSQCIEVKNPSALAVTGVLRSGKKLMVEGANFDSGAKILINGAQQKTSYESSARVIGKKAGKKIKSGDKVQVRNSDGTLSNEWTYSP
jgi:titin